MKVLFNALDQNWTKECTCTKCSSKLQVDASDLTFVADSRDGNAYTFICPICKEVNWLNAKLVPKSVAAGVQPRRRD